MIRLSGRMTPRVIASRSSATFLPEKSSGVLADAADAADAALCPALRAPFAAVCCLPRALPPAFAARLRAGELDDADDALDLRLAVPEPDALRAVDPDRELALERRLLDDDELLADLRALDVGLRALEPELDDDLRADEAAPDDFRPDEPEPDDDLRALDARDDPPLREPDPLDFEDDALRRDDPPPLPPVDSAISFPPQEARAREPARAAPHYLMPSAAVTYA
jgi:hypothetical protein